ncbi:hypothetical protein [Mycolicibacterium helvum]|uniref:hypothetical protein n=1 Tax=Mycolicibacterium helvum TaxID=1534349 RepID=UPI00248349DF|nr:hypothetical protein [Mycolicibacterium helvum]
MVTATAAALGVDAAPLPDLPRVYEVSNAASTVETAASAAFTGSAGAALADAVAGRAVTFCAGVESFGFRLAVAFGPCEPAALPAWLRADVAVE